jgi:hypothetical protein
MARMSTIGRGHTTIGMDDTGKTVITYHSTAVVKFDPKNIILNSGGWHTASTRTRMNQTSNQFNLGFTVFQKSFSWYVQHNGKTVDFSDNMKLKR